MRRTWVAAVLAVIVVQGCSPSGKVELRVSAASSLRHAFVELESRFEQQHPEVDVLLNIAGSATLREQILEGAPVDVFASADMTNMTPLVDAGLVVGEVEVFALNSMAIAVPSDNPAGVTGLSDLGRPDLVIGLCAESVPCGSLAREVLANAGVVPSIDTEEPNVASLLTKIEAGELDTGIVYVTDVTSGLGSVDAIAIPPEFNVVSLLPIAALIGSGDTARDFVDFVASVEARSILTDYGFGAQ